MKVVIDIPEEEYARIMSMDHFKRTYEQDMIYDGTPLPKGHGKIVDIDTIDLNQDEFISQSDYYGAECAIENAPTIIEADNAESEGE